jgi:hypothetical protein
VSAHADEIARALPGDELVPDAQVVMDRGFDLPAPPEEVWPWLAQLGRKRAGWYLPRRLERILPVGGRALRHIEPSLQHLAPGDVIDDWGGRDATFEIVVHDPPSTIVHRSHPSGRPVAAGADRTRRDEIVSGHTQSNEMVLIDPRRLILAG